MHAYVYFGGLFLFQQRMVLPALMHLCAPVWWLFFWLTHVSGLLRPCVPSRESLSTHSLHPPAVAVLWDTEASRAQIEPLLLGPAPFFQQR